ncbi:uncharacterized protein PG986_008928 [Apiospora aurea]|uniref:RGS domain-containing protein n=1 Tax=Apiospora aurea TaxID=335848 RepID=A0ABR1Q6W7_9PEZI
MGKSRLRGSSPTYLTPSPRATSPPSSVYEDWDTETAMSTSRPASLAIPRTGSPAARLPSLSEILNNTAAPPWTLSAFTAYLSQNHCLETLEFLIEAERYTSTYVHLVDSQQHMSQEQIDTLCSAWDRMMQTYITPYGSREVNLPAPVRDRLLALSQSLPKPPTPSELNEAVSIVEELMSDSVLVPFCQSVTMAVAEQQQQSADESREGRHSRSRLRVPKESFSPDESSHSPKNTFLPLLTLARNSMHNRSSSIIAAETADADLITDDSSSPNSTPGAEPVTPPTTPPTSDFAFSTSPNGLQRAITGNSWGKKMSAKLGLNRKSRSMRRSQPTNMPSATSADMPPPTTDRQFGIPIMRVTGHTITRNHYEHYDYVP